MTSNIRHFKNSNTLQTLDYAIIDNIIKERIDFAHGSIAMRKELDKLGFSAYPAQFGNEEFFQFNQILPEEIGTIRESGVSRIARSLWTSIIIYTLMGLITGMGKMRITPSFFANNLTIKA